MTTTTTNFASLAISLLKLKEIISQDNFVGSNFFIDKNGFKLLDGKSTCFTLDECDDLDVKDIANLDFIGTDSIEDECGNIYFHISGYCTGGYIIDCHFTREADYIAMVEAIKAAA